MTTVGSILRRISRHSDDWTVRVERVVGEFEIHRRIVATSLKPSEDGLLCSQIVVHPSESLCSVERIHAALYLCPATSASDVRANEDGTILDCIEEIPGAVELCNIVRFYLLFYPFLNMRRIRNMLGPRLREADESANGERRVERLRDKYR